MIKRIKQLISQVQTKCSIWQFKIQLKPIMQRNYISLDTVIPYLIFTNFISEIKIFFESFTKITLKGTVLIYKSKKIEFS